MEIEEEVNLEIPCCSMTLTIQQTTDVLQVRLGNLDPAVAASLCWLINRNSGEAVDIEIKAHGA